MTKQIHTIFILVLTSILIGCQPEASDIQTKRSMLKEKQAQLKVLQTEIDSLIAAIDAESPQANKKTSLVTLDTLRPITLERYATLQASVMSDELVNISSEIGGRLLSIRVREGDYVRKGQLIATIDTEFIQKQIDEVQTRLTLAETVFEKQKRLWDKNIGSEIQYLEAKNNKESIEKSLETLKVQLSKSNIYSPVNGSVDREFLESGELASPGMPIVSVLNTNKLKVVADVPENYLVKVNKGQDVSITFPAIDKVIERKISMIGRSIDPSNRTFKIEIMTDNLGGILKPNLLAEASFKDLSLDNVIAIPIELVQEEVNGNSYVYVGEVEGDNMIARKKYVQVGESSRDLIEVKEGLSEGDIIVLLGARTIVEGDYILDQNK
jgi:RND family efflux transporter MFP subunit